MTTNLPVVASSVADITAWGQFAKQSGIVPPAVTKDQAAAIVQTGRELGLQPMQSLRSMSFISGRLTMSVQLQLALARSRGVVMKDLVEDANSCKVTLCRNEECVTTSYTMEDAKKAGLASGQNYQKYGKQMLRWRAIGDGLRLIAPDIVMGLLDPIEAESLEPLTAAVESAEAAIAPATPAPAETPVEGEYVAPATPPPAPKKKSSFLESVEALLVNVPDGDIEKILAVFGIDSFTDVKDREEQKKIYKTLKQMVEGGK